MVQVVPYGWNGATVRVMRCPAVLVAVLAALVAPATAIAQEPPGPFEPIDPLDRPASYCPDTPGAPVGEFTTDREHRRIVPPRPLPAGIAARRVQVAGTETRLLEAGPRDAREAVLFVHGNPGSSEDYVRIMDEVGGFARAIAFDVPGLGHAGDQPGWPYSFEGVVRTIDELLAQLGIDRVHLVVHDLGGPWAFEWAVLHNDAVQSVTIMNSGVFIDYYGENHPTAQAWHTPGTGEAHMAATTREMFTSELQRNNPKPLPAEFVDRMYDDFDRPTRCAVLAYYREIDNPDAQGRAQAATLRRKPDRPALVVWGEGDTYIPRAQAERQRHAFPKAQIHMLSGAGHWPFVDEPERVQALVVPFLRNVVPPLPMARRAGAGAGAAPPRLAVRAARARRGQRALRIRVRSVGRAAIGGVVVRLHRGGGRGPTVVARRVRGRVVGLRRLTLRLGRRGVRRGRWTVVARAPGVPAARAVVRVR